MPHDKNGTLLQVGDTVTIKAKVTQVQTHTDYCNINLETVEPMYPGNTATTLVLNCKQVEKAEG